MEEIRFEIRYEFQDGCAKSFSAPVRVVVAYDYVTLLEWSDEHDSWVHAQSFPNWKAFADAVLPERLRKQSCEWFHDRTVVISENED